MHIAEEIIAPESWASVRIETAGAEPDLVDELLYEIRLTRLRLVQEESAVVVYRGGNELALRSFVEGIVPDLGVRGFRATWQKGI